MLCFEVEVEPLPEGSEVLTKADISLEHRPELLVLLDPRVHSNDLR